MRWTLWSPVRNLVIDLGATLRVFKSSDKMWWSENSRKILITIWIRWWSCDGCQWQDYGFRISVHCSSNWSLIRMGLISSGHLPLLETSKSIMRLWHVICKVFVLLQQCSPCSYIVKVNNFLNIASENIPFFCFANVLKTIRQKSDTVT